MRRAKMLVSIMIILFLSTTMFAQVEKTVKETKAKIEKIENKSSETKKCASAACCTTEAKEMKAEMKAHGVDCKCESCTTAHTSMKKGEKMMKKAHATDCDCEGCKVAHAEMKKQKAHGEDCTCGACQKS